MKGQNMTIKSKKDDWPQDIHIDLTGPEGNAYVLLGYAQRWLKQMERDPQRVIDDMTSGDYEHLLEVFEREFGEYCTLYR